MPPITSIFALSHGAWYVSYVAFDAFLLFCLYPLVFYHSDVDVTVADYSNIIHSVISFPGKVKFKINGKLR